MEPKTTYFVAKLANMSSLKNSLKSGVWACSDRKYSPQPKDVLSAAIKEGRVVLLFSVNNCHGWHGFASMETEPGTVTDLEADIPHAGNATVSDRSIKGNKPVAQSNLCNIGETVNDSLLKEADNQLVEENPSETDRAPTSFSSGTLIQTPHILQETVDSCSDDGNQAASSQLLWHRFRIQWQLMFLWEHGEQCLPFTSTQHLVTSDAVPVNNARNWQEVSSATGEEMCLLMKNYYDGLSQRKKDKLKAQLQNQPDPFFQPESAVLEDPHAVWARLVDKVNGLGKVLLACAFGSQRYNLQTPGSDMDMFVVYAADTKDVLGFNQPQHTIKNRETECCDYTIHEVHRYCELLLAGDPRCVETLFLHPSAVYQASDEWHQLCQHRQHFLTRLCVEKYLRDAMGAKGVRLLDKWVQSGEGLKDPISKKMSKLFYIILRLLQNARDAAEGKVLRVYREKDGPEYQLLMATRRGQYSYTQLRQEMESLQVTVESALNNRSESREAEETMLRPVVESWLLEIRYKNFKAFMDSYSISGS